MAKDKEGKLQDIMDAVLDGEMQNFKAKGGAYTRENFLCQRSKCFRNCRRS